MFKKSPASIPDDPQLGPYLFQRKSPMPPVMMVGIVAGLAGVIIAIIEVTSLAANGARGGLALPVVVAGGLGLALGVWLVARSWKDQTVLHFHQRGVARVGNKAGRQPLGYEQITAVKYHAVRMHYNGVYTGTKMTMIMTPAAELGYEPFKYVGKLKEKKKGFFRASYQSSEELEPIYQAISERIAGEMLGRIAAGQTVPWTKSLALRGDGLMINGELLPWERLKETTVNNGRLAIKAEGKWLAAATAGTGDENFLAAWIVLGRLLAAQPARGAAGAER
jgi:hypothetical protein